MDDRSAAVSTLADTPIIQCGLELIDDYLRNDPGLEY
jgi:hypothetical protein